MSRQLVRKSLTAGLIAAALILTGCSAQTADSVINDQSLAAGAPPAGVGSSSVVDNTQLLQGPGIYFEAKEMSPGDHGQVSTRFVDANGNVGKVAAQNERSPIASQINLPFPRQANTEAAKWFNDKTGGADKQAFNGASSLNNAAGDAPEYLYGATCGTLYVASQELPHTCIGVGYYYTTTYWYVGGPNWSRESGIDIKERTKREFGHYGICNNGICLNYMNSGANSGGFQATAQSCRDAESLGCLFPQLNLEVARSVEAACVGITGCLVAGGGLQGTAELFAGSVAAQRPTGFQIIKPDANGNVAGTIAGSGWTYKFNILANDMSNAFETQSCQLTGAKSREGGNCIAAGYVTGLPEADAKWFASHTNVAWADAMLSLMAPWLKSEGGSVGHLAADQVVDYMNSFYTVGHTAYTVLHRPS